MKGVLPAPIARMKHEPAARLDRSAVMHGTVGRFTRVDVELLQQAAKADPRPLVADSDADRAILVVGTHRDHRALEAGIGHPGHGEQKLAGKEDRLFDHRLRS